MNRKNQFFKSLFTYSIKPATALLLFSIAIWLYTLIFEQKFSEYVGGLQKAMIFNVFLAAIPLPMAFLILLSIWKKIPKIITILASIVWLLFLPNSPYIITDFIHVNYYNFNDSGGYIKDWVPWAALCQFAICAFIGCAFGFLSLFIVQKIITFYTNQWLGWGFSIFVLVISSVALFLGRVLRFNSWELFYNPLSILHTFKNSISSFSIMFCMLFSFTLIGCYIVCYCFFPNITTKKGHNPESETKELPTYNTLK